MTAPKSMQPDDSLTLALAVVGASSAPLVLLDGDLTVVAASASFFTAFDINPAGAVGEPFLGLGDGEWNLPRLRSLLTATLSGAAAVEAYEMELESQNLGRRNLLLNAHLLAYGDGAEVRLLLGISDVTEARASDKLKDDLLREKAILLQEVQHRVANSLQIIASVILQSARKSQSDETRNYLTDAHSRVMSVAALQQQLAVSRLGEVALKPYFDQLCVSVGASMIRDHDQLSLHVDCDDSTVPADISVSLGLIVTELVINSLKHAFPGGRHGRITVSYHAHGPNWTLAVADNGVGMPTDSESATPGLGTSIVEALANQLNARVQVAGGHPGTTVSVIHTQISAVEADAKSGRAV
ncbi:histidine kinase [Brevundimonas denitrificans]|uniref:histidine kinase n=1 Tax=Brevundimonas denitrificans TaxID=1443434 RepID=A0ABQ6BJM2_9CAUL|nr:sensor histidine kinase [Brevundimonas denitrificans]GLS01397.1 histidine kinase [Brevundimonas denitrificans]